MQYIFLRAFIIAAVKRDIKCCYLLVANNNSTCIIFSESNIKIVAL